MAKRKSTKKPKVRSKLTARTADKHTLYQLAVQDADVEIQFITRVFKKKRKRAPLTLREDFCGSALLCATWIKGHKQRSAVGIDLDRSVLAWGKKHNLAPLNEPGDRVKLLRQDVRSAVKGPFDVAVAFNFSYWVFKTRQDLRAYFESVYRSLKRGGLFYLDGYGGLSAQEPLTERRRIKGGFTYIWQQDICNPIDHHALNHIHFQFPDGSKMRKAFTYDWRYWTMPEIRELLQEAGFRSSTVYWEGAGKDGTGDGIFRPTSVVENEESWISYVVAER